ncbi:MAG TPA: DUF2382 domain-containing protein [Chitinophagaceae bacterium]
MEQRKDPLQGSNSLPDNNYDNSNSNEVVIPVIEEYAVVQKEIIETGKVHLRKTVTEDKAIVNLPIINESYDITRVPISNEVHDNPPPAVRYEGDTMIIPVVKEVTVMVKRYEVIEEVRITKKTTEIPLMQEITLRRESVHIERPANSASE